MYVALTRAKNILVIPSVSEKDDKTFMEFVAPIFDQGSSFETFSYSSDKKLKQIELKTKPNMTQIRDIEYLSKIPKGYVRTTATEEKGQSLTGSKNKYPFIQRPKLGIAFHSYVECSSKPIVQDALIQQIITEHGIETQKDELIKLVTTYLNSELYHRIQKSKQVLKEIPFSYFQDGILYEGYIDLMFEELEGFVIVDLKTDNIKESEIESRSDLYRNQLDIYAYALKNTGQTVKEKLLYFTRLNRTFSV